MNYLAVLNLGGQCLADESRASMRAACERWGCRFSEVTEPPRPGLHPYWQKTFVIDCLPDADRILQLDADMLVRSDCPSPFEIVREWSVGLVADWQGPARGAHRTRQAHIAIWAKRTGLPPCSEREYLNAGFILYAPRHHGELWRQWQSLGEQAGWFAEKTPEQTTLSLLLHAHPEVSVAWLPREWNFMDAGLPHRPLSCQGTMHANIYHFTGPDHSSKWRRIAAIPWEADKTADSFVREALPGFIPPRTRSILQRIPADRPFEGAEVGVFMATNARALLRNRPKLTIHLVDAWENLEDPDYQQTGDTNICGMNCHQWRHVRRQVMRRTKPFREQNRAIVRRGISERVARDIRPGSLDFVFIDGNHSYRAVSRDIRTWLPKIRPGGWIGGHDYQNPEERERNYGVTRAVQEWMSGRMFGETIETGEDTTWFVQLRTPTKSSHK